MQEDSREYTVKMFILNIHKFVIRSLLFLKNMGSKYPTYKINRTQCTPPTYEMDTPDRVDSIMDNIKQKLDNTHKLTLK